MIYDLKLIDMKYLRHSDFEGIVKALTDLQATFDCCALKFVLSYADGETYETYDFYRALLFISFEFDFPKERRAEYLFCYDCNDRCIATFSISYTSKCFNVSVC
nr:MAG: hypothetical protein [Microvirus Sku14]